MVDVAEDVLHNADVQWNRFSSEDYWQRSYRELQAEDREIIRLVRQSFTAAFRDRLRARRAIDIGSGTSRYPALLMPPWTNQILQTDFSASNIRWLRHQLEPGYAGIERRSVFGLQKPHRDLGTMFFVAEYITEDLGEFRASLARLTGALKPGSRERPRRHRHERVQADSNERPT
jgi:hypothetical protein